MAAIDDQHLCPRNSAEMPAACDEFLTAEVTLGGSFVPILQHFYKNLSLNSIL